MGGRILPEQTAGLGVHGTDTRSNPRKNNRERSTSESKRIDVESGSRESEVSNSCTIDQVRRVYRNVLIGELKDLGCGRLIVSEPVRTWLGTSKFSYCCELAGWEFDWVSELFTSIESLPDSVRKPITLDCVEMLKAVARLHVLHNAKNLPSNSYLSTHSYDPDWVPFGNEDTEPKLQSSLSRMSKRRYAIKRDATER